MMTRVYRCPRCGNTSISYDYGLRTPVCTQCKAPLRGFKQR